METKFNFFDSTFHQDIYQGMVDTQENRELLDTLTRMQTAAGIPQEEATAMAGLCIAAVTSCESVRQELSGDAQAVVADLLADAEKCGDYDLLLHKLYFGMAIYPDYAATESALSADELFWRYYNENKGEKTAEELKDAICDALGNYSLSPEVLQAMVKKMESSGDYLATAVALGEGGISFKCIAAMELYLKNRDTMTVHEAANIACAGVEIQAAADAVSKGMITRATAKKILIVAGITLAVVGIGILIFNAGSAATLAKAAAGVADQVIAMPEVFAEFATGLTAAGEPGLVLTAAETIRKTVYFPLIKAAEHKQLIGGMVAAGGAVTVGLSQKTANLIGKFRTGFTDNKAPVLSGLQEAADYVAHQEESVPEEQPSVQKAVQKTQQTATVSVI